MSKSKNTIDPEEIIKNFEQTFVLQDVQWSDQGMSSSFKFLQKLWF